MYCNYRNMTESKNYVYRSFVVSTRLPRIFLSAAHCSMATTHVTLSCLGSKASQYDPKHAETNEKPLRNAQNRLETQLGRLSGIVQRRFHHGLCPLRSAFRREEHRHLGTAEHVPDAVAREHDGVTALAFELLRGGRTASEGPQSPAAERRRPLEQPTPGKTALKLILVGRRLQEAVICDRCPTSSFILGHLRGAMLSGSCC